MGIWTGMGTGAAAVHAGAVDSKRFLPNQEVADEALLLRRLLLQVRVEHESGQIQLWSQQKFLDRFVRMLSYANGESLDTFFDDEDARYEDIFWDQMDHVLVGSAAIGCTPLLQLRPVSEMVTLRGPGGEVKGVLAISMNMRIRDSKLPAIFKGSPKPAEARSALKGVTVAGEVHFGHLMNVDGRWAGLFARFSWFNTQGRLTSETTVVEGSDLGYTFSFEQSCSEEFLDFLEKGVVAIQVRAFEPGKAKDFELRDLRLKLRQAENELSRHRSNVIAAAGQAAGQGAGAFEVDLARCQEEAAQAQRQNEELRRELELLQIQQAQGPRAKEYHGIVPGSSDHGAEKYKKRCQELEAQLQEMRNSQPAQTKKSKACVVM